ncbi:hypothetical protein CASFOL_038971 [Castilleja foliolosa]|uniref:DNA/RNA-binding protein Alba-like domain-containing protein n=1 Tax=Castilleja foliolosa TaxID=1961234 RepID=A0ABD3BJ47_9LAMI
MSAALLPQLNPSLISRRFSGEIYNRFNPSLISRRFFGEIYNRFPVKQEMTKLLTSSSAEIMAANRQQRQRRSSDRLIEHFAEMRYMQQHNEVELSALGMAISSVVSIAEILKNNGFAVEKKITTSTVEIRDDSRGRPVQKAKIEVVLGKTANFDQLMASAQEAIENGNSED